MLKFHSGVPRLFYALDYSGKWQEVQSSGEMVISSGHSFLGLNYIYETYPPENRSLCLRIDFPCNYNGDKTINYSYGEYRGYGYCEELSGRFHVFALNPSFRKDVVQADSWEAHDAFKREFGHLEG